MGTDSEYEGVAVGARIRISRILRLASESEQAGK